MADFTYDIYTGERHTLPYSIECVIDAIRCAFTNHHEYIVLGGQARGTVGTKVPLSDESIHRLRHSPEFHDAAFEIILRDHAGHRSFLTRIRHFEAFTKAMRSLGVLGRITLIREEDIDLPAYITPMEHGSENNAKSDGNSRTYQEARILLGGK